MAFLLNTSTLGAGAFRTFPTSMDGPFRDLQIRFYQNGAGEDLEIHFLELHFTLGGVSKEVL
jgi:hypothetical protein